MNNSEIKYNLLLTFQKVLLFNITASTRVIMADVVDEKKLSIWVFFDKSPTLDEKDVYYSVSAEVTGDFVELDESLSEVHFLTGDYKDEDFRDKLVLFARCDHLDLEGNLIE